MCVCFVGTGPFHEAEKPVYQTEQARPRAYKCLTPFRAIDDEGDPDSSHSHMPAARMPGTTTESGGWSTDAGRRPVVCALGHDVLHLTFQGVVKQCAHVTLRSPSLLRSRSVSDASCPQETNDQHI